MPDRQSFERWFDWLEDLDEHEFVAGYVEGKAHNFIPRNIAKDIQTSSLVHSSSLNYFKKCDHMLRMTKTLSALQGVCLL